MAERWHESEKAVIKNEWPELTVREIADMIEGRTFEAVKSKVQDMQEKGEIEKIGKGKRSFSKQNAQTEDNT